MCMDWEWVCFNSLALTFLRLTEWQGRRERERGMSPAVGTEIEAKSTTNEIERERKIQKGLQSNWRLQLKTVTLRVTLVITFNSFNGSDRLKRRSQTENLQEAVTWCSPRVLHVPLGPGSGPPPLQRFWCCWVWSRRAEGRLTRNELSHVAPPLTRVTDSDSPATAGVCGHSIHMWEALPPDPI